LRSPCSAARIAITCGCKDSKFIFNIFYAKVTTELFLFYINLLKIPF
jgi:hypothetical protein